MHFLLCIEYDEYDKEMSEYIISHLSDDVANNDLSRIIEKFKQQLLSQFSSSKKQTKKSKKINGSVIECKYEGDELSGIFSYLKKMTLRRKELSLFLSQTYQADREKFQTSSNMVQTK